MGSSNHFYIFKVAMGGNGLYLDIFGYIWPKFIFILRNLISLQIRWI